MSDTTRRETSGRSLIAVAASLVGRLVAGLGAAPAQAVPASVPAVRYSYEQGFVRLAETYGAASPVSKVLSISAETRQLRLSMSSYAIERELICTLYTASGQPVASSVEDFRDHGSGRAFGSLAVGVGVVIAGSKAKFTAECIQENLANRVVVIMRYVLTEGAGTGATATYLAEDRTLVERTEAEMLNSSIPAFSGEKNDGQTVGAGARVRLLKVGMSARGRTNSVTVTVTSGSTTVPGLDVNLNPEGSILGFTVPAGLAPGRVDFAAKVVSWRSEATTSAKTVDVTRWTDSAIYDPNLDGNSFIVSPHPKISGYSKVGAQLEVYEPSWPWQPTPASFSYQWLRDGVAITGATSTTYRVVEADFGHRLAVSKTGIKAGFRSATSTSLQTSVVDRF